MARKKQRGGTSYAYFKNLFLENPSLLEERSNAAILARYREDHGMAPDAEISATIRNNLANLKSNTKRKLRDAGGGSAEKRMATMSVGRPGVGKLESLEEMIDDCMAIAKNMDPEGLHETIRHLRKARNLIIFAAGGR